MSRVRASAKIMQRPQRNSAAMCLKNRCFYVFSGGADQTLVQRSTSDAWAFVKDVLPTAEEQKESS